MQKKLVAAAVVALSLGTAAGLAGAQEPNQIEQRIDASNRTLSVRAQGEVSVEPEVAILHVGFVTAPQDAKAAYAAGSKASNAIVSALVAAGVEEKAIRSESQHLDRDWEKPHRYKLSQQWTVRTSPERAAEILDVAIDAGATSSGEIEWTVKDEKSLEDRALNEATTRLRQQAEALARGMGVKLGNVLYVTNQMGSASPRPRAMMAMATMEMKAAPAPLAIEPQKVTREASVYAVFAIE